MASVSHPLSLTLALLLKLQHGAIVGFLARLSSQSTNSFPDLGLSTESWDRGDCHALPCPGAGNFGRLETFGCDGGSAVMGKLSFQTRNLDAAATHSDRNALSRVAWGPQLKSNMVVVFVERRKKKGEQKGYQS